MHAELPILPLAFEGVGYRVGERQLLQELSFTLEAGTRTVVLGPNGAGKSLALRLAHGLIQPTSGQVRWLGPGGERPQRRHAMVFQRPVMLRRSAVANVAYALALGGQGGQARAEAAAAALDRFGLGHLAARPARVLSGGEQQRLALARAWALHPQVLFLDEPTASLDPAAAHAVEQIIAEFHQNGVKIVMTTHDLAQARRLADEVMFLHQGRLIERSAAEAFFAGPVAKPARAFVQGELVW